MSKKATEFQRKAMSRMYRGREIFKPLNTGWTDNMDFALAHKNELCSPFKKRVHDPNAPSYGTFVLMDVLADRRLTITTTIADGMPTMDYADVKNPVLQNIYLFLLTGFSYWLIGKAGPIRKKIVCKMMGRTEESLERILYRDATWRSWANQDR